MTPTTLITADEIIACRPCCAWPHDRIRSLVGEGIAPLALARHPDVSLADRRWALTQVLARRGNAGRRALVRWACDCAQGVRHLLSGDALDAADLAVQTALAWCEGDATAEDCRAASYASYASCASYAAASAADCADYAYADAAAYADTQNALDALAAHYWGGQ